MTQRGSLCPAKDCFLSDYYKPRLELEKLIENDIFVCETYCVDVLEKDEWKRFFKLLGVHEGITALQFTNKLYRSALTNEGLRIDILELMIKSSIIIATHGEI